ncbi:unnamed protein product [Acanthoscelides obtectus]|uniref:Uncharacterized protein n=1 Tax=Acanthoscelides obtectus TaxID=200917 RepID=A0A9P0MN33_ACAOB|nr:unnamed protein product [Acanthoscelides obtectus]CAK1677787.1 hypothetical protein AOBTE_LOCUS31558 [Acanthoscelides obtectus]
MGLLRKINGYGTTGPINFTNINFIFYTSRHRYDSEHNHYLPYKTRGRWQLHLNLQQSPSIKKASGD